MKIYEIVITNNDCDGIYTWHFTDRNNTLEDIKTFFKKTLFRLAAETDNIPDDIKIYPGPQLNGKEILHGVAQFSDFHLEATLCEYDEYDFYEVLAVTEQSPFCDNFTLSYDNGDYDEEKCREAILNAAGYNMSCSKGVI